jgi:hypothetical protein
MENRNNVRFIAMIEMPFLPGTLQQPALSVEDSLRKIARDMRVLETSYQDAIREFQQRYIVVVLIKHACHLGSAAADLGMHRNSLTRIMHKLEIDPRLVRRGMRGKSNDRAVAAGYAQSVWRHSGDSVNLNSESQEPPPNAGARAGA